MDKKKKFFIGLGILVILYVVVMSLNLTHEDESKTAKDSKSSYSKENVINMLKSDDSELDGYFSATSTIKQWFSFLLPRIELLNNGLPHGFCTIKNNGDDYILLSKEHSQCVLFVNKSDESARLAALVYEVVSNQTAARGPNLNKQKAKLINATAIRPKLTISKTQMVVLAEASKQSKKKDVLMVFLAGVNQSEYQLKNPDKKKFQLKNFQPDDKEKQVAFKTLESKKFELIAPEEGGTLVLKCSDCSTKSIKIRPTD